MSEGIKINERFELRRDKHSWMLVEHISVNQERRDVKNTTRETYTWHATPKQACMAVLERTGGDCKTANTLMRAWDDAVQQIREVFEKEET